MKALYLIVVLIATSNVFSQNEEDALRYSKESLGGTARNLGMAGAMTALGGDYSSTLKNPAASGKFSKSNFSFTTFIEQNQTTSDFRGQSSFTNSSKLKLGNLSYLKAYKLNPKKHNGWYSIQLGMGYNRKQSFNKKINYSGTGKGSIIDYFIVDAGNTDPNLIGAEKPFVSGLAYDNYVIDPYYDLDSNIFYDSDKVGSANQNRQVIESGGMGEINLSISGNYKNKLLLGASFNIVTLNYKSNFTHIEKFADTSSSILETQYAGHLDVDGSGVNIRIGAIYKPLEFLRIGLGIETPTRLVLNEQFGNNMINKAFGEEYKLDKNPSGAYDYIIRTPFKANLSLGIINKELGSIGAEIELVDYTNTFMKSKVGFSENYYSFETENKQIKNLYTSTFNLKIGFEGRLTDRLYLRGGYALMGSAYKPEKGVIAPAIINYTGGVGYNFGEFYIDFATVIQQDKFEHISYSPDIEGSTATINQIKKQFVLSIGARF